MELQSSFSVRMVMGRIIVVGKRAASARDGRTTMCHRFTMLTPDEVDRVLAHLRAVARLLGEGALGGPSAADDTLPTLHRPRDIADIDAFPGSECWVIVADAEGKRTDEEVSHVRMFHVKHSRALMSNGAEQAPAKPGSPEAVGGTAEAGASVREGTRETHGGGGAEICVATKAAGAGDDLDALGPLSAWASGLTRSALIWGIDVSWKKGLVFNTRIESALAGRAMWRDALDHGRCLVPVRAFFETRSVEPPTSELLIDASGASASEGSSSAAAASDKATRRRRPQFRFAGPGDGALLLAGLRMGDRFTIVTTEPNDVVAPVHHRMPLVLNPVEALTWLNGTPGELAKLADRARVALERAEAPEPSRASGPGGGPHPDQLSLF